MQESAVGIIEEKELKGTDMQVGPWQMTAVCPICTVSLTIYESDVDTQFYGLHAPFVECPKCLHKIILCNLPSHIYQNVRSRYVPSDLK